jgi:3-phosphoshikimate 1-carboxyvinyltransferase
MNATVFPSLIHGTIQAPASKSCMQRACAAALLRVGKTIIKNFGISNDDVAAVDSIKRLGALVEIIDNQLHITSQGVLPIDTTINCGESGLSVRLFTSIAALSNLPLTITGSGSLLQRPMDFFDTIFPILNINIKSNQGKLPFAIQGPMSPQTITIDGSLSSQFLTGLLFAYSASNATNVWIHVTNLKSKPYVDLTLDVLSNFGMKVPENKNYTSFYFNANTPAVTPDIINYTVEGDWSGGAFLLVAGAIAGKLTIKGLDNTSSQADKALLNVLKACGCELNIEPNKITVSSTQLNSFYFDATECPDLFPPLVALALYCKGTTTIKGISRLTHKESNRALTLKTEFEKLGATLILQNDEMLIQGLELIKGAVVHSHHDHRIAMALSIAALKADKEVIITEAQAINKSYPNFFVDLKKIGVTCNLKNEEAV